MKFLSLNSYNKILVKNKFLIESFIIKFLK
nr:MAG TPA: hypothetical protein [Caudoviricetes sp.]